MPNPKSKRDKGEERRNGHCGGKARTQGTQSKVSLGTNYVPVGGEKLFPSLEGVVIVERGYERVVLKPNR